MKNNEMKNIEKKHWYDMVETGIARYPRYHLTHWNGDKEYTIMVLSWNTETNKANGWFQQAGFKTIRECREYMKRKIIAWGC